MVWVLIKIAELLCLKCSAQIFEVLLQKSERWIVIGTITDKSRSDGSLPVAKTVSPTKAIEIKILGNKQVGIE